MTAAIATALAAAWATTKRRNGETVTYTSGSAAVELTAVLSMPQSGQVDTQESITMESRSWNWLIDADWPANAPAAFTGLEPSQGDTITRADGTVYQVQPSSNAGPCWRYSDGQHTFRRIFCEER